MQPLQPTQEDWETFLKSAGVEERDALSLASAKMEGRLDDEVQTLIDQYRPNIASAKETMIKEGFNLE